MENFLHRCNLAYHESPESHWLFFGFGVLLVVGLVCMGLAIFWPEGKQ